jgi:hypothetical protein
MFNFLLGRILVFFAFLGRPLTSRTTEPLNRTDLILRSGRIRVPPLGSPTLAFKENNDFVASPIGFRITEISQVVTITCMVLADRLCEKLQVRGIVIGKNGGDELAHLCQEGRTRVELLKLSFYKRLHQLADTLADSVENQEVNVVLLATVEDLRAGDT